MKRIILFAVFGAALLIAIGGEVRANIEEWYFKGADGCSEFIIDHNTQYNYWTISYRCCGTDYWCVDETGIVSNPCGQGITLPTAGTGTPAVFDSQGNQIVSVAPGCGGHIAPGEGYCRSFIPDGSSTLVIPPWGLQ
ncbi:MAG: hypothetical protein JST22_17185 [Bacteroidetes bacterium]|nr:hypothetical protein [Bacteroidota bacterium]